MTTETQTTLRLTRIDVKNFRCFKHCSLDVDPRLTVLVAENAQGKTALLDAVKITLDAFVSTVGKSSVQPGIMRSDVHISHDGTAPPTACVPTLVHASGFVDNRQVTWGREVRTWSKHVRNSRRELLALQEAARAMQISSAQESNALHIDTPILPMVGYYGTGRLWEDRRFTHSRRFIAIRTPARMSAYLDCLAPDSSFEAFSTWYGATMRTLRQPAARVRDGIRPETLLAAVRDAVKIVLHPTGWAEIDWEFSDHSPSGFMVVESSDGRRFPISQLSDGVRNMIALVGDIAHRCARVNPHLGETAAQRTPGILLIDEVDLHLHPRWQQQIVELLRRAFPNFQLILTTHSPHVLSTVDANSIRIIDSSNIEHPVKPVTVQTQGVASADVLAKVMGVDPVPNIEQADWLRSYRGMVQNFVHDGQAASLLWEKIILHFGPNHPAVTEIEMLRRLVDFKQRQPG